MHNTRFLSLIRLCMAVLLGIFVSGVIGCHTVGKLSSNPLPTSARKNSSQGPTAIAKAPPVKRQKAKPKQDDDDDSDSSDDDSDSKKKKYKLKELLKLAWRNSPRLKEAQYFLKGMKARQDEAFWTSWWPQGSLMAMVAPAPPARGDAMNTTTPYPESLGRISDYGILTRLELSLIWPLYTFGKLSLLQKAAGQGVKLGEARVRFEKAKWDLIVKKSYYGLQFAESLLVLLDEAEEYTDEAKKKVKGKTDKLKIKVIEADVQSRRVKAELGKRLAQSSLARLIHLPPTTAIELDESELEAPSFKPKSLEHYQKLAKTHRPEVHLLNHALKAKRALYQAQRRLLTPDFFIGAFFRWGYSSAADDQKSPFARDDFNFIDGGVFLGMRFSLNVPITLAKIRRVEAELKAFESQRKLALVGLSLQVEQCYRQLKSSLKLVKIHKKGRKAANQWLSRVMISYSSGLSEVKDISEALLTASRSRFSYLDSVYKLRLAMAQLSQAVGKPIAE